MLTPKGGLKPGVEIVIGGETYIAPQLNFGAIRRMSDLKRYEYKETPTSPVEYRPEANDLMAYVIMESLNRNYSDVNAVWLNETLLGSERQAAALAELEIMRMSGMIPAKDQKPGEAGAVTG